jgi:hypothetical protein
MQRRDDWESALGEALVAAEAVPFAWGTWDCVHFVASVVEAMTGTDPLTEYRGAYADEAGAWAVLAERDGNLRQACRRVFGGMTRPCFARRGDVVMLRGGMSIGICLGRVAVFASEDGAGLVARPMSDCSWAFPVGWAG